MALQDHRFCVGLHDSKLNDDQSWYFDDYVCVGVVTNEAGERRAVVHGYGDTLALFTFLLASHFGKELEAVAKKMKFRGVRRLIKWLKRKIKDPALFRRETEEEK